MEEERLLTLHTARSPERLQCEVARVWYHCDCAHVETKTHQPNLNLRYSLRCCTEAQGWHQAVPTYHTQHVYFPIDQNIQIFRVGESFQYFISNSISSMIPESP